jgi:hypothetical protein
VEKRSTRDGFLHKNGLFVEKLKSIVLPNLVYFGSGAQKQIILAAPISKSKVMI